MKETPPDVQTAYLSNQINSQVFNKFLRTVEIHPYKCFCLFFTHKNINIVVISPPRHEGHMKFLEMLGEHDWKSPVWLNVENFQKPDAINAIIFDLDLIGLPKNS
jgi:hypothetical protein